MQLIIPNEIKGANVDKWILSLDDRSFNELCALFSKGSVQDHIKWIRKKYNETYLQETTINL